MPSTHITIAQTLAAAHAESATSTPAATPSAPEPAPTSAPRGAAPRHVKLTPSMRRMILNEHRHGDWFRDDRTNAAVQARATLTFDAMKRRGLIGPDHKPTLAAIQAALS